MKDIIDNLFSLEGFFRIELLDKNDKILQFWEHKNKLIDATVNKLADYVTGVQPDLTDFTVNKIKLGTGGLDENGQPIEPTGKENDIKVLGREYTFNQVPGFLISDVSGLATSSRVDITKNNSLYRYTYSFTLEDANDKDTEGPMSYSEFGLFLKNGDMLCYRTFPISVKDSSSKMKIVHSLRWKRDNQ